MLTDEQKAKLKEFALAGLSFSDAMRLLPGKNGNENALEIYAFPEFHNARAEARLQHGQNISAASESDPEYSKFWLTHVGGWSPSKPMDLTGLTTVEDCLKIKADLDRRIEQLIDHKPVKQLKDEN